MTDAPAIEVDHLTKNYGSFTAVDDLSLTIEHGEIFGFLGPNGAGKSTTIRSILDLIRPTKGACRVLGLDSRRDAVEIRRSLGFLPADLALYPNLTGRRTIEYLANLLTAGDPEPVTSAVPTPYELTGAARRDAIAYSSRSFVTVIFVPVAPSASSWSRASRTTSPRSPESMRIAPSPVPATSIAVAMPWGMS